MAIVFEGISPIFPVRDIPAALDHYAKLGFEVSSYEESEGPIYGFVRRGGIEIHITLFPEHDPKRTAGACYLYVNDADALYEEWRAAGVGGRLRAPEDTPYSLREFAHVDPEGNLPRVGSRFQSSR